MNEFLVGTSPTYASSLRSRHPAVTSFLRSFGGDYDHFHVHGDPTDVGITVLQRVQSDPPYRSMRAREQVDVVQNLIMGTARPSAIRNRPRCVVLPAQAWCRSG